MGIDPQTHKPISPPSDDTHLPEKEQKPKKPPQKQQQQQKPPPQEPEKDDGKEVVAEADGTDGMDLIVDGFCTDEVPLMEPHEILVPSAPSSSSSSTSTSYSSSSSSSSSNSESAANLFQDLIQEFPEFEWPNICENGIEELLEDDFSWWDFVVNYERGESTVDPCVSLEFDPQSWAYGLL